MVVFRFDYFPTTLQSQVYRSQPDLVSAVYDSTASTLALDYSYGQYPNQTDASQNYSQYLYPSEYPADSTWIAPEQRKYSKVCFKAFSVTIGSFLSLTDIVPTAPPRPATPEKFSIPHRCARFGPGGHLVQVLPNLPSAGQPALVDIHNIEVHVSHYITASQRGFFLCVVEGLFKS